MSVSMKSLVQKDIARTVKKHVVIKPEQVADLLKKAVGAPDEVPLVTGVDQETGSAVYTLDWTETPKPRAPRKPKAEAAAAEGTAAEGTQAQ